MSLRVPAPCARLAPPCFAAPFAPRAPARAQPRAALVGFVARVPRQSFALRAAATPPEESEEDAEAALTDEALEAAGGDSTRAGAGMILALAGNEESQVSKKAAEVSAAVGDLNSLANAERDVLLRAQAMLKTLGVVAPPLVPDDIDDEDNEAELDDGVPGI